MSMPHASMLWFSCVVGAFPSFARMLTWEVFFCVKIATLSQKLSLLLYHPSNVPIAVQHNSHKALHLIRNSKLTLSQCVNHIGQKGTLSTPLSVNEWHTICWWPWDSDRPIFLESMGVPVCGTLAVVGSDAEEDRLMRDEWYSGQAWLGLTKVLGTKT